MEELDTQAGACEDCAGVGSVRVHSPEDYGVSFECEECESCGGTGSISRCDCGLLDPADCGREFDCRYPHSHAW